MDTCAMKTRFHSRLAAWLLLSTFTTVCLATTQAIKGVGIGKTQDQAERAAYEFVLLQALERLAGMQARRELGRRYRARLDRNFEELKRTYFSPDTDSECITQNNGKTRCQVRGLLILTALQSDIRKHTKSTERRISNRLVFYLAAPAGLTKSGQFVLDKFEGAVVRDGHRILYGRKARRLIKKRQVDFGLAIEELSFTPPQYDRYDQRLTGTLTIRFKLNDLKNDQRLAANPVTVVTEISGPNGPALKAELNAYLAQDAARQLASGVFESVINHQEESAADKAALSRKASGGVEYAVRLMGVSQRDRRIIRGVRTTIKSQFAPASPTTSHQLSDESQVTLLFTVPQALDPDDLLDSLYEQATENPNFDAQYLGNNVFEVQWQ
jgi:hypothetical protein